jgi:hypothetical protein
MAVVMVQLRIPPYVNCLPLLLKVAQWFRTLFTPVNPFLKDAEGKRVFLKIFSPPNTHNIFDRHTVTKKKKNHFPL